MNYVIIVMGYQGYTSLSGKKVSMSEKMANAMNIQRWMTVDIPKNDDETSWSPPFDALQ